jgi:tetratricopeptide (TPR) repeat protein
MNERSEAVRYMEESLDITRDVYTDQHPRVAVRLSNLGSMYRQMEQYEDARRVLKEALTLSEQTYGPNNPTTGLIHLRLGFLEWQDFDEFESAEMHLRRAASIRGTVLGPDHPDVAYTRYHLANLMRQNGRLDEAMDQYREVLPNVAADRRVVDSLTLVEAETTTVSGIDDRYPNFANGYALLLREMGRIERACQVDLHALTAFSLVEGPNSTGAVKVRERLETCDRAQVTRSVNR